MQVSAMQTTSLEADCLRCRAVLQSRLSALQSSALVAESCEAETQSCEAETQVETPEKQSVQLAGEAQQERRLLARPSNEPAGCKPSSDVVNKNTT